MSYQATAVTNALAFRLKGYTNAVQESVAKKLYFWGKKNVPRDDEIRTQDKRKQWGKPWHIAERGGAFLRGKRIIGPNFRGKPISVKEGSIALIYSNKKKWKSRNGSTRIFDYAQAPVFHGKTLARPENIKTFLDQRLTISEIKIMINESLRECSNKL